MTAEEVEIPFAPKQQEPPQADTPPRVQRSPEPISEERLATLRASKCSKVNGMELLGDYEKFPDPLDIPVRFCCHCQRYDLAIEKDRAAYGDLLARSMAPSPTVEITWEERCKESSGLIVYLTFFEYVRVAEVSNAKSSKI